MKKKNFILGLSLLAATTVIQVPTVAKAASWGMSLNPGCVWRYEGQEQTTPIDYSGKGAYVSLTGGDTNTIYARAVNSRGELRAESGYVEKGHGSYSFKNNTMAGGHTYRLNCRNNYCVPSWIWASGQYDFGY